MLCEKHNNYKMSFYFLQFNQSVDTAFFHGPAEMQLRYLDSAEYSQCKRNLYFSLLRRVRHMYLSNATLFMEINTNEKKTGIYLKQQLSVNEILLMGKTVLIWVYWFWLHTIKQLISAQSCNVWSNWLAMYFYKRLGKNCYTFVSTLSVKRNL